MKLNTDIILRELSKTLEAVLICPGPLSLQLKRPFFWTPGVAMEPDRIYLVHADDFPRQEEIARGDLLISVGEVVSFENTVSSFSHIHIKNCFDILQVFNLVQVLFDKYDAWDAQMRNILDTVPSIQALVDCSEAVLDVPIVVMDRDFRYIAYSSALLDKEFDFTWQDNIFSKPEAVSEYIGRYGTTNMFRREDFYSDGPNGLKYYTRNLFDHEQYVGSVSLFLRPDDDISQIIALAQVFFDYTEQVYLKEGAGFTSYTSLLKDTLHDMISGITVDEVRIKKLMYGIQDSYICIKIMLSDNLQALSTFYCCSALETNVPGCIAFEHETIVVFLNLEKINCSPLEAVQKVSSVLMLSGMKMGISNPFSDLSKAQLYYREACIALKYGMDAAPLNQVYLFNECVLDYILSNCAGEFPVRFLLEEYLGPLIKHDEKSAVSFMDTLQVYLSNNMNAVKTAEMLHLHRSTLSPRLDRIRELLPVDLENPSDRLLLMILLNAKKPYST